MQKRLMPGGRTPGGNNFPASLYIMKGLLGVKTADQYQHHVCINDCMRFAFAERSDWAQHQDDACTHCYEPRFIKKEGINKRLLLQPQKVRPAAGCLNRHPFIRHDLTGMLLVYTKTRFACCSASRTCPSRGSSSRSTLTTQNGASVVVLHATLKTPAPTGAVRTPSASTLARAANSSIQTAVLMSLAPTMSRSSIQQCTASA